MPEYQLKFTGETDDRDESRQRTLDEIYAFMTGMDDRPLAIVTLNEQQSGQWDQDGDIDYQDEYGRQIIAQVSDDVTETLVIRNHQGLPVALAAREPGTGWQGLGIDERLRFEVATALQNDETEFE